MSDELEIVRLIGALEGTAQARIAELEAERDNWKAAAQGSAIAIERLENDVDALLKSVRERGGSLSVVGSEELLRLATTRRAALEGGQ